MPYEYLEEEATADVAFLAKGKTLEELFRSAADATMNVMIDDLDTIAPRESRPFSEKNRELDLLLFDFLQELVYHKDIEQLLLRAPDIKIEKNNDLYTLSATLKGECLSLDKHGQGVDVKAVTLHQFYVKNTPEGWAAHVILDI